MNVRPGEAFRLFPFGKLVKGGKTRDITPELARQFKLPHFKPPIKLGSHAEETPAGGHIKSLEVRNDGLYAIPEFTDKGTKALDDGDYRYHSPEVIWEGGFEDPDGGPLIEGPLIVGDALLHSPHLGEATALYQVTIEKGDEPMSDVVQMPTKVWDQFMAKVFPEKQEIPGPKPEVPEVDVEKFEALQTESDGYKAKIESMEADQELQEMMSTIAGEFDTEEYGAAFIELGKAEESAEVLASLDDKQRSWVMTNFKALSKQIDESALIKEKGTIGEGIDDDDAVGMLNAVVLAKQKEEKVSYNEAMELVKAEQPELVESAYPQKESK